MNALVENGGLFPDLYDYLSEQKGSEHLFKGSYLTNYSWGEYTLAELTGKIVLD